MSKSVDGVSKFMVSHAIVSLRKVSVCPSLASGSDLSDSRSRGSLECVDTVLGNERTCQLIFDGLHFLE